MMSSDQNPVSMPDDPGLTAYALGELEGAEQQQYAAAVADSPELQALVAEIRRLAGRLTAELEQEPAGVVAPETQAQVLQAVQKRSKVENQRHARRAAWRAAAVAAAICVVPAGWYVAQSFRPRVENRVAWNELRRTGRFILSSEDGSSAQPSAARTAASSRTTSQRRPHLATSSFADELHETEGLDLARDFDQSVLTRTEKLGPTAAPASGPERVEYTKQPVDYLDGLVVDRETIAPPASAPPTSARPLSSTPSSSNPPATPPARVESLGKRLSAAELAPQKSDRTGDSASRLAAIASSSGPVSDVRLKRGFSEAEDKLGIVERLAERDRSLALVPAIRESRELSGSLVDRTLSEGERSGERYQPIIENRFAIPAEQPQSTFSIDVDTASMANLRRILNEGRLPPPDAIRIEELINYFSYQYPQPADGQPFSVQADLAACPWSPGHHLVRIGLKGKEVPREAREPANLVFLIDVSGSMASSNKLPLVQQSLTTLVQQLEERDRIAIVTYANGTAVRLPSTPVSQRDVILSTIADLSASGSTNGGAGLSLAYDIAAEQFQERGANRVILCTDGDFNVGITRDNELVTMIQKRAKGGVFLSVFGFGMGNLQDAKLEQLADKGNGQYGYIDDPREANKVFVEELTGTLITIAKDVKIQVEFEPGVIQSYRLIGYENRALAAQDFHDDKKDAGEIGAGHSVTALYEVIPVSQQEVTDQTRWMTIKLRYKQPQAAESSLLETHVTGRVGQVKSASNDFQFAAGVAALGMLLRQSPYAGQANWSLVKELIQSGLSHDPHGHRQALLGMVAQAEELSRPASDKSPPMTDPTVGGRYQSLLRKLNVPEDVEKYGRFNDYGFAETRSYAGSENLPSGYWVYVAPHWYIWADSQTPAASRQ